MSVLEDLIQAKRELSRRLLKATAERGALSGARALGISSFVRHVRRNIHAVGVGRKLVNGRPTGDLCIRFYVAQKLGLSVLPPRDLLPKTIDGLNTDVIECPPAFFWAKRKPAKVAAKATTKPKASKPRARPSIAAAAVSTPLSVLAASCTSGRRSQQRPVYPGISVAHHDVTAGTIACFCRSARIGDDAQQLYLLSNNHVLANSNNGHVGDEILQPGPVDGGVLGSQIAALTRFVPLHMDGQTANRVDCAIAALLPGVEHQLDICKIGRPSDVHATANGVFVRKHGRTSGYSEGVVTDVNYDAIIGMDPNTPELTARFEDQIRIDLVPGQDVIGLGGDSGSLVVERDSQRAIGLYFAGPDNGAYGIANHLTDVFSALEIQLA